MRIIFDLRQSSLSQKIGKILDVSCVDFSSWFDTSLIKKENLLFVGRGLANLALKRNKEYPKCWEICKVPDNIDYLRKIILNDKTLEKSKLGDLHRRGPEKIVAQKFDYDCGWGMVCTTLLMLNREDVLKTDVYKRLEVNPRDGTKSQNIKKLFEEEKIPYLEIWKASLADVANVLNNNGLVMISYQSEGTEEEISRLECGHYSTIFDIDQEYVWLIDPSWDTEYTPGFGKGVVRITRDEFDKMWLDKGSEGELFDHWMLAVRQTGL